MKTMIKQNRLVIFMTDMRYHVNTVNQAIKFGELKKTKVVGTITNSLETYKLLKSVNDIPTIYFKWDKKILSREDYDKLLVNKVNKLDGNTILLTGWKHIFTSRFYNSFDNVINIHPALPNSYIGLNCIEKALNDFKLDKNKNKTGVMVHRVVEELDRGEVLDFIKIPIFEYDDLEYLTDRFREYERLPLLKSLQKLEKEIVE